MSKRSYYFSLALKNNETVELAKPCLMEIVNLTPDSFYDGGKNLADLNNLQKKLITVLETGVRLIDIGGESSRPGSDKISWQTEWKRIKKSLTMANKLKKQFPAMIISLDTTKVEVAKKALAIGIDMVNDVSAGDDSNNEMLAWTIAENLPIILMHRQGDSLSMQDNPTYRCVVEEVFIYLKKKLQLLKNLGAKKHKVIVDPGIGFGKTKEHNILLLKNLNRFKKLHAPILIGASMKRIVDDLTGEPLSHRLAGSIGLQLASLANGADILRVHHSREMLAAIKTYFTIKK